MEKETITTQTAEVNAVKEAGETKVSKEDFANPLAEKVSGTDKAEGIHTTNNEDLSVSDSNATSENAAAYTDKSAKRAEFEKLIKGDYKEFYEERVKENLNRRFKENAVSKKANEENREIVEMLCDRYNVEAGDMASLKKALEDDDAYLVAQANKRGIGIEDFKYIKRLERENRRHLADRAQFEAARRANQTVEKWFESSMELKGIYPDFDIFAEAKNPSFVSLIQKGIDVKTAYEVVHHKELMNAAIEKAGLEAEKKTAEAIKQRSMRPAENALSSKSSAVYANGISSLTPREREDIARRAARGEKISF